jgi:murein DD-endopeptidase MepM/ murein hydrolase activator NlpD
MRALIVIFVIAVIATIVGTRAEPFAPTVTVEGIPDTIGRGTAMHVTAKDRGSGLAHVEVRLVPADGGDPLVLARQDFPRQGWLGSGVYEATLTPTLGANVPVPEGHATLEVWAADHSWLSALRRSPRYTHDVTVDVTPPALAVLSKRHAPRVGGSELAILRVGNDAQDSGVQVGDTYFPATTGVFRDPALRAVLFAVPENQPTAVPVAVATDAAGNRAETPLDVKVEPHKFAEKTLPVTDAFLSRKVPELLAANGMQDNGDLLDGYLRINRDLRQTSEARIRELCRDSASTPLWTESFVRMPAAPLSGFADRRTYTHNGQVIDHQTHLGYDLASLKNSTVPAANSGVVVYTGPLGIYGNVVILDHGLGLFSLYGHLSEIGVKQGAKVKRGDPIGKTGDTGLAAGDHLHFSMMVHGVHVDPTEWWDPHWMGDHVMARLAEHPKAPPSAEQAAPPAGEAPPPTGQATPPAGQSAAPTS